nr:hypothetical protein N-5 - Chlamydia trachomatis plasmid pLGV440 [Chlamydia trachomatis]
MIDFKSFDVYTMSCKPFWLLLTLAPNPEDKLDCGSRSASNTFFPKNWAKLHPTFRESVVFPVPPLKEQKTKVCKSTPTLE